MTTKVRKAKKSPLLGVVVRPGTSVENKTGGWGIVRPEFDWEACRGCATCETICPEGCIYHTAKKEHHADLDFCKGCGLCAAECPAHAIKMVEEVK